MVLNKIKENLNKDQEYSKFMIGRHCYEDISSLQIDL